MKLLRYIFFPIVPIYYGVTWLRNKLFDLGVLESTSYDFPVICVGNLSVGGTGKTPMIEYLIRTLKNDYKLATLSRGYKRKSEGFQVGKSGVTADVLGDEPFQFYSKYASEITVAVDADRGAGILKLRELEPKPNVILLDDAFQHRKVKAGFNIMLTTYFNLFTDDYVLPTGDLREPKSGAKRADIIVVTKCPTSLKTEAKTYIVTRISPEPNQKVFFSTIKYAEFVVSKSDKKPLVQLPKFTLITGIANPKPLVDYLLNMGLDFEHLNFKDHHDFTTDELETFKVKSLIITTEKDFMRLNQFAFLEDTLYYLGIEIELDNPLDFNASIQNFITSY
ncbi:tetraacyldisaccharide 4'-kinase' [Formosa agariphila KMM 3901]|uniref:Tetraacyldisaccharide 4'-kinase n=1 Tax=Formosa agariphila (strain DSM 15362 / KCTC 12365 / LMG 23005 / KMM 3901 / M-2Alg 35-1) TaxID=1347342 RepID=T2KJQ3_FORAG|nr:tetraacyldisaccharide 4'-kinase [Formosa agariphila]CDF78224.1 tetraacyldisaccharide 4'-kinase' [Formosa agariphila KMM 3901]